MKVLRSGVEVFFFGNIYAVVLIAALLQSSSWIYQVSINWEREGSFILFATLFLYPFHRIYGVHKIPEVFRSYRHHVALKHRSFLWGICGVGLLGAIYFAQFLSLRQWIWLTPLAVVSMGYVLPLVPSKRGWMRLREVPGGKVFWIAAVVSILTGLFPFLDNVNPTELGMNTVARFCFLVAITIPFDIRDYSADKHAGTKTLPVLLGIDRSRKLALFFNVGFTVFNFIAFFFLEAYSLPVFLALWMSEILADMGISKSTPAQSEYFFVLAVEGHIIWQAILVVLASWFG